jgi:hypothetical protein
VRILDYRPHAGKTTELVELMLEPGNEDVIYVAPTIAQADNASRIAARILLQRISDLLGYDLTALAGRMETRGPKLRRRFLAAHQVVNRPRLAAGSRFVVDETDGVLGGLLGGTILAAALTSDKAAAEHKADRDAVFLDQHVGPRKLYAL